MKLFRSLVFKVTAGLCMVLLTLMSLNATYEIRSSTDRMEKDSLQLHNMIFKNSILSLSKALWDVNKDNAVPVLKSMFENSEVIQVALYDDNGALFAGFKKEDTNSLEELKELPKLESTHKDLFEKKEIDPQGVKENLMDSYELKVQSLEGDSKNFQTETRIFAMDGENPKKVGYLLMTYGNENVVAVVKKMKSNVTFFALSFAFTIVVLCFFLLRFLVVNPIIKIAKVSQQVAEGSFTTVKGVTSRDEIGKLASNFNKMVDEIQKNTTNLVNLAKHGKIISKQVTLHSLSKVVDEACRECADPSLNAIIYYSNSCFESESSSNDFFLADAQGQIQPGSAIKPEAFKTQFSFHLKIQDAHDKNLLAVLGFQGASETITSQATPRFLSLCNSIASAITTVRLEKAFKDLDSKTRDVRQIFQTVQQGIGKINENGCIGRDYSACLESLFEVGNLESKNLFDILSDKSKLSKDDIAKIKTFVSGFSGEDIFYFEMNQDVLPRDLVYRWQKSDRFFELDWAPLVANDGKMESLMFTVRDVTILKQLRQTAETNRKEMLKINEIVNVSEEYFHRFISSGLDQLTALLEVTKKHQFTHELPDADRALMKRVVHTLKGNARSLKFTSIVELSHSTEQLWLDIWNTNSPVVPIQDFVETIYSLQKELESYQKISEEKLKRGKSNPQRDLRGKLERANQYIHQAVRLSSEFEGKNVSSAAFTEVSKLLEKIEDSLLAATLPSLSQCLGQLGHSLADLAIELNKPAPKVDLLGELDVLLPENLMEPIMGALNHLGRNSLDHGFQREKQEFIFTKVSHNKKEKFVTITYQDTGIGLNLDRLREKMNDVSLSNEQSAMLIFVNGVSTSFKETMVSGRGVGMDAAKSLVEGLGGTIELQLLSSTETSKFNPQLWGGAKFLFRITLPLSLGLRVISHQVGIQDSNPSQLAANPKAA
jgi:HAMP domain-containing protein/HPt (histidine-containing phosphotransfer) domain-containing protein